MKQDIGWQSWPPAEEFLEMAKIGILENKFGDAVNVELRLILAGTFANMALLIFFLPHVICFAPSLITI